jgi:two-component system sensor histidine kinase YesM
LNVLHEGILIEVGFLSNFYKKISIKTKLMLIAIIFIVYPILIIGYFGYRNYADTMKRNAIREMQNSTKILTDLLSDRMTKLSLYSIQMLYDNTIYNAERELTDGGTDYIAENEFTNYLQSNLFLKSELNEILIRFSKNNKIYQVNKSLGSTTDSYSQINDLYGRALKGNGKPVWHVSEKNGRATGIYIAKIIYDINDIKQEIGLLIFKVSDQYLSEVLNNYISNSKQNISLLSSSGQEVYSYEPYQVDYGMPVDLFIKTTPDASVREVKIKNDVVYSLHNTIQPENWNLVMGISSNVLLKDVRDIARLILILCAATLPICILLVNFLYRDIVKPMNLLIKGMRQVERGAIGITIEKKRFDEFGYVYGTFNKMSLEIKNLINTVYKKQIATKDAEIKALQAQINPHFLYNTLDSISWRAKINGVNEISEMVSALSSIIEANLNRNNENFVPLSREIEYINNYYLLLKKRFGKKISLVTDIGDDIMNCTIPKLIIQPIIENAVYHGLEMKVGSGTIHLSITREEGRICIKVCDDGIGIDEATLDRLRQNLSKSPDADSENDIAVGSSIGIINVHKRIRLLYGEDYGLEISSKPAEGTTVTIILPVIFPEGAEKNDKGPDNR